MKHGGEGTAAAAAGGGTNAAAPRLKQRPIPDPPEMATAGWRGPARFLLVLALAAAVIALAVGALNTLVDPYGMVGLQLLPTATTPDRTLKADAIENLQRAPQLVVLGSSRSKRYQPSYLREKTGLRTFNAGVSGIGGTADSWAMARFIDEVWPGSHPAWLWLLDVESFVPFEVQGRTAGEPRLAKYIDQAAASRGLGSTLRNVAENRLSIFSWVTAKDSLRVLTQLDKLKRQAKAYRAMYLPDGGLKESPLSAKELQGRLPKSIKRYSDLYRTAYRRLDPEAQRYFEEALAFMNAQGATPLIVLTPINPKLRDVVGPLGWDTRHQQVLAYLEALASTYHFLLLDNSDPVKFHYDPQQFYDGVHMTDANTRRAIDYILEQTGGIPQ
ncbi:MAG: hypothetical protein WC709_08180 [Thermoleophilia bacterium]